MLMIYTSLARIVNESHPHALVHSFLFDLDTTCWLKCLANEKNCNFQRDYNLHANVAVLVKINDLSNHQIIPFIT